MLVLFSGSCSHCLHSKPHQGGGAGDDDDDDRRLFALKAARTKHVFRNSFWCTMIKAQVDEDKFLLSL